jgi:LAO/AO transport system kinase
VAPGDDLAGLVAAARGQGPPAVRAAARLMTVLADEPARLPDLFQAWASAGNGREFPSPRLLVGITGAPGCGNSTLTDALVRELRRRHPERRLGVIAVDPSSPFSGGAVLGDRIRMMRHATDPMVFVRSLATRGHLGGLTLGVKGIVRVMAMVGCDSVFIETVGVGQSEVEIASVADVVMVVLAPGQGDSIQLLKAGLMEIGDLLVVNKADRPDAARLHAQVLASLTLAGDDARAHLVCAEDGMGVGDLVDDVEATAAAHGAGWATHRAAALHDEIREAVLHEASQQLRAALGPGGPLEAGLEEVLRGRTSVRRLSRRLLEATAAQETETPDSD